MLDFNDQRWDHLKGGYKTAYDPRPSLRKLERRQDTTAVWKEFWNELHHQGDVGDASYAAVPELVRICRNGLDADWNLYAIVATIEVARTEGENPPLPEWLKDDYFAAIQELAVRGAKNILVAD